MNKSIIYKHLSNHLQLNISDIINFDPDSPLTDINMSSITMISFIVDIENEFNIEILDSDLIFDNFSTLNKLFKTLSKYLNNKASIKKCLILDADNVLWRGISGEEEIIIDDSILIFQRLLIELYNKGIILCLCSKNSSDCIDISFNHPKMLIKKEHFALMITDSHDKSGDIFQIANNINILTDSLVFADDSDYEIGFVTLNLPEVISIKIDHDRGGFIELLSEIFDDVQPISELNRTQLYREQKEREKEKRLFTSIDEYNSSLETQIYCEYSTEKDFSRLAELSARTNQFNLSAIHYTEDELKALAEDQNHKVFSLSVKDKYGDMGIVGMAVVADNTIEAFMISCRVFGRDIEIALLNKIKETVNKPLFGIYQKNSKNGRFASFYRDNGVSTCEL